MRSASRYCSTAFLFVILLNGYLFAQFSEKDKLLLQLSKESNDTNRIKILIRLGSAYAKNDSEQDHWFKEVHDLSRLKRFGHGLAFDKYYEGCLLLRKGSVDEAIVNKAIEYFLRARGIFKTFDPYSYTNESQSIGMMYMEWGNQEKADEIRHRAHLGIDFSHGQF